MAFDEATGTSYQFVQDKSTAAPAVASHVWLCTIRFSNPRAPRRVARGVAWDAAADIRKNSPPTFWRAVGGLSEENQHQLRYLASAHVLLYLV